MKKPLPNPDFSHADLFGLPYAVIKWELLKTAIELNVFEHLEEPASADMLADMISTHPENTEYFLNGLVALGCLSKKNGEFKNTHLAATFLSAGKDTSIGPFLLFMENMNKAMFNGGLKELVLNGPPKVENIGNEETWAAGARTSLNHSRCGRAQLIASRVASLPEFDSFSKILDLGAGPGIIGLAVAAAHPSLKCFLFDQPAVCRVADETIDEYGMRERVETIPGDYMNDPIGNNYDFIMANYTLNFFRERLYEIFDKMYQALNPGGVFMVISDGLSNEKTAPAASVISWLPTSLQGMNLSFEQGTIANAMIKAGFVSTQSQILSDIDLESHGPMEMIIGRKKEMVNN